MVAPAGASESNRATHAADVLEFSAVLDLVGGFASSEAGRQRVRELVPLADRSAIAAEQERVGALRALVAAEAGWTAELIPDIAGALARLHVPGTVWSGQELRGAWSLLGSSRRTRDALRQSKVECALLAPLAPIAEALLSDSAAERRIESIVNEEGVVRDDASPALRKLRRELRGAEADLVRLLERLMAKLEDHHRVDDASVTMRNGRYVIPVRREGRAAVGGIVHDASSSGVTVFVEPPAAVEAGNRIRELESEEQREVHRVLLAATDDLRPMNESLIATLDALVTLDALAARARYAAHYECAPVTLAAENEGFVIVRGRHPLLLARGGAVVPFDLLMEPDERTLLVSGPNTGGKTVLLKATALISLMVQSGVPAPVGPESRIAVFDRFFADIGDEQSIAASLSTFSAHVRNLGEILHEATAQSLVLVDELGSGTDPVEGAALGGAILEELTRRGTTTIATTHLGALKQLAQEVPGVVNASLQFDAVALAPTYRLLKGVPGRSYGIAIARRLALPGDVLDRAERRVPEGERDLAALLEALERRTSLLGERETGVEALALSTEARLADVTGRERTVRERERELDRKSRQESRRYLLDAREEIEQAIRELKASGAEQMEEAALTIRRRVERRAADEAEAIAALDEAERLDSEVVGAAVEAESAELETGAVVEVGTLGDKVGRVLELRSRDAVVVVGALKLTVPRSALRRVSKRRLEPMAMAVPMPGDQPDVVGRHEVDVRGMRVGEVDTAVLQAVDDAVRADLAGIRIIHGKGTGALRERVAMMLRGDRRIKMYRLGLFNEGGAGVTVVEFA